MAPFEEVLAEGLHDAKEHRSGCGLAVSVLLELRKATQVRQEWAIRFVAHV